MALDVGPLPIALTNTVARVDFNAAMDLIQDSFPLAKENLDGDAVVTVKIKDLNVTTAKLALLAVTVAQLGPQAVETAKIKLLNITHALLALQAVETDSIKLLAVTAAQLGPQAVETAKIKLLNITAALLGPQAVETAKIKLLNITEALLGPLAVTAAKIQTDAVETLKIKNLNVTAGKAALGFGRYVPRRTADYDMVVGDFTTDGNWKVDAVDFSGIVPVGTIGVILRISVMDGAANNGIFVRTNATDDINEVRCVTQVANVANYREAVLPIDANRLMDYYGENTPYTMINLAVVGYFI